MVNSTALVVQAHCAGQDGECMKLRLHARLRKSQSRKGWITAACEMLDRAIAPVGTVCVLLGLVAAVLQLTTAASYLIAAGLLFRLVVWFAKWREPDGRK